MMKRYPAPSTYLLAFALLLLTLGSPSQAHAQGPVTWQQTAGPVGGAITVLALHPDIPERVFAGTGSGLFVSEDAGAHWERLRGGTFGCQEINALAICSDDPALIYTGTSSGLFKSSDAGASWARLSNGLADNQIWSVAVHPCYPQVLYVGTERTVYQSLDRGATWGYANGGLPEGTIFSLAVHPENPYIVYAGTNDGIMVTADAGQTWYPASFGLPDHERVSIIVMTHDDPARMFVGTPEGLYASSDGGANWRQLEAAAKAGGISAIAFGAGGLYIGGSASIVLRSTDGGETWAQLPQVAGSPLISSVAISDGEISRILLGTNLGCYSLVASGENWAPSNVGMVNTGIRYVIDVPATRAELYAATSRDIYHTRDGGASWRQIGHGPWDSPLLLMAIDDQNTDHLYACTQQGDLYRSTVGGREWQYIHAPLVDGMQPTGLVICRYPQKSGITLLYLATKSHGLHRSTDQGASWQEIALPGGPTTIQTVTYVPAPTPYLLVSSGNEIHRLAIGLSEAAAIEQRTDGYSLADQVTSIVASPYKEGIAYASTSSGEIYRSADGGRSWDSLANNTLVANLRVEQLLVFPHKRGMLLICAITDAGIFCSYDSGENWTTTGISCLRENIVYCMAVDDREDDTVYLGTRAGVYRGIRTVPTLPPAIVSALWGALAVVLGLGGFLAFSRSRKQRMMQNELVAENWDLWSEIIDNVLLTHRMVTLELLQEIPAAFRPLAARRYIMTHRDNALSFHENPLLIEPVRQKPLQRFAEQWRALVEHLGDPTGARPPATRLTEQICDLLGFTPLDSRVYKNLFGCMVSAPTVRLSIPQKFPIIFALADEPDKELIRDARDLMQVLGATSFFALLIIVQDPSDPHPHSHEMRRLNRAGEADDFIVLSYRDLISLFWATDAARRLIEIILDQVDLTMVSPYIVAGAVPENMFFGRDYELKAIMRTVRDRSFAIVGGRKIGKTSVLTKVQRLMEQAGGFAPLYLDCQYITNHKTFFGALALNLQLDLDSSEPDVLRRVMIRLRQRHHGKALVMLLDETDRLLLFDTQHQYRLFLVFRALSQEGLCRFLFCGERYLYKGLHDPLSPLFNFCSILQLSYLLPRDARRIIQDPMSEMGILFADEDIILQEIIDLSSCHPNIIQQICKMLLKRVSDRGDRMIRREDLAAVRASDTFQEYLIEVTWGNANMLECLITVLMAHCETFTTADVRETLSRYDLGSSASIQSALQGLELYSILHRQGHDYSFAARSFQHLLIEAKLVDSFREGFLESLQAQENGHV